MIRRSSMYRKKYRKNQMKIEQLNHHCYVEKHAEQNTTKFVQINVEHSLKLIACRINVLNIRNATRIACRNTFQTTRSVDI